MKRFRIITQGIFLLLFLFLFLQTESKGLDELGYPVRLFLDFDPLRLFRTSRPARRRGHEELPASAGRVEDIQILVTGGFGQQHRHQLGGQLRRRVHGARPACEVPIGLEGQPAGGRQVHPVTAVIGGFTSEPDSAALAGFRDKLMGVVDDALATAAFTISTLTPRLRWPWRSGSDVWMSATSRSMCRLWKRSGTCERKIGV